MGVLSLKFVLVRRLRLHGHDLGHRVGQLAVLRIAEHGVHKCAISNWLAGAVSAPGAPNQPAAIRHYQRLHAEQPAGRPELSADGPVRL